MPFLYPASSDRLQKLLDENISDKVPGGQIPPYPEDAQITDPDASWLIRRNSYWVD
jgi:hypothetical protein